jgi:hypothetical protein
MPKRRGRRFGRKQRAGTAASTPRASAARSAQSAARQRRPRDVPARAAPHARAQQHAPRAAGLGGEVQRPGRAPRQRRAEREG